MTTTTGKPPIAEYVKRRRNELGLTQEETTMRATAAGHQLSHATLRAIEQGRSATPHPRTRQALAAALDVDVATVGGWVEGTPTPAPTPSPVGFDQLQAEQQLRALVDQEIDRRLNQPSKGDSLADMIYSADRATRDRLAQIWEAVGEVIRDAQSRAANE